MIALIIIGGILGWFVCGIFSAKLALMLTDADPFGDEALLDGREFTAWLHFWFGALGLFIVIVLWGIAGLIYLWRFLAKHLPSIMGV